MGTPIDQFDGRIEIETTFPDAHAINFLFDQSGNSQGFNASPLSPRPATSQDISSAVEAISSPITQTFWGQSTCPAIEGLQNTTTLTGKVWTVGILSAGPSPTVIAEPSGLMCGGTQGSGDPLSGNVGQPTLAPVVNSGRLQLDCVICVYR